MRNRWWAAPLVAGAAVLVAACGSTSTPPASHSTTSAPAAHASVTPQSGSNASTVTITTHSTSKGMVLANGQGRTIYWFAKDTPTTSNCSGTCATYWPPVIGKPAAASGASLPKGFGTITRAGGQVQATYDGHPLYTYMGDTAAGQISGNGLNLSGGLWWAMTPGGAKLAGSPSGGSTSSPAGTGGGGGY
jgi:predicted lipoprotein with Yx(FWY)xxD motif